MPLSPSWKTHFLQGLAAANAIGDRNAGKFTEAMTHDAAVDTKMKYLNEDNNLILVADNKKQVVLLHNIKNLGGTTLNPTNKVAALIGMGPDAQAVALDVDVAITSQSKRTQTAIDIIAAAAIGTDTLRDLRAPTRGDPNFLGLNMFTPAPFLRKAILEAMSPCPFEIIQAAIAAHTLHVQEHVNDDGFNAADLEAHRDLLLMWCLAVGQNSIPETRYSLLPDDDDLKRHKANTHLVNIQPTLEAAAAAPIDPAETVRVLQLLGASMERSCEASEAQSEIQKEHVAYLKEKDKKKKDKAEKWHGLSRRLVLNAASTNGHVPATEIPESYQLVINSETAAMADKELHSQMVALGHREIGFAHGTAASLYNGSIIWNARDKPSNLSFFTLYENNPLNDEQKSRYLHLNILNSNTDNKNLDEIKASQKQIVSVPKDYAELLNVIKMYRGMVTILFGPESALTVEMGRALALIEQEVSTIKVRIAGDFRYPAKILYAFEIRIQRWLNLCEQQEDRSTINDSIIDMDQVMEQILHSSLTIDLPLVFTTSESQKKEGEIPTPTSAAGGAGQPGGEKKGRKRKGGGDDDGADRRVVNTSMVEEFKMKEGEDWRKHLAGKLPKDRPKWGDTPNVWMCARWLTKGDCFIDCNNKACHVGADAIPAEKKNEYLNFLKRVRNSSPPV